MWKRIKIYSWSSVAFGSNPEKYRSKNLIWIKTNTEKKVDKVLPGNIFILISFKEKVFTQINSQQMNTFRSSSRADCAIQINFNLNAVDKGWNLLYWKRSQSE